MFFSALPGRAAPRVRGNTGREPGPWPRSEAAGAGPGPSAPRRTEASETILGAFRRMRIGASGTALIRYDERGDSAGTRNWSAGTRNLWRGGTVWTLLGACDRCGQFTDQAAAEVDAIEPGRFDLCPDCIETLAGDQVEPELVERPRRGWPRRSRYHGRKPGGRISAATS